MKFKKPKDSKKNDGVKEKDEYVRVVDSKEDNPKEKKPFPVMLLLKILAVVLVVGAVVGGIVYFKTADRFISVKSNDSKLYPIEFVSDISDVVVTKNNTFVVSGTNLSRYDHAGDQKEDVHLNYNNPKLAGSGSYILVYDAGGVNFRVYNSRGMIQSGTTVDDTQIVGGAINSKGNFILFTRPRTSSQYASYLNYYKLKTEKPKRWGCVDYIVSGAISDDTKNILVCGINANLMDIYTNVYLLSVKELLGGKAENHLNLNYESAVLNCSFSSNKNFVVNFDNMRLTYSLSGKNSGPVNKEYEGELINTSTDEKGNTVVATKNEDGQTVLSVYNKKNEFIYSKKIKNKVNDVCVQGKKVYVLTENSLILVREKKDNLMLEKYDIMRNKLEIFGKQVYNYSSTALYKF